MGRFGFSPPSAGVAARCRCDDAYGCVLDDKQVGRSKFERRRSRIGGGWVLARNLLMSVNDETCDKDSLDI